MFDVSKQHALKDISNTGTTTASNALDIPMEDLIREVQRRRALQLQARQQDAGAEGSRFSLKEVASLLVDVLKASRPSAMAEQSSTTFVPKEPEVEDSNEHSECTDPSLIAGISSHSDALMVFDNACLNMCKTCWDPAEKMPFMPANVRMINAEPMSQGGELMLVDETSSSDGEEVDLPPYEEHPHANENQNGLDPPSLEKRVDIVEMQIAYILGDLLQAHSNISQVQTNHWEQIEQIGKSTNSLGQNLDTFSGQFHALSTLMATQIRTNEEGLTALEGRVEKFIEYVDGPTPLDGRLHDLEQGNLGHFGAIATQDRLHHQLDAKVGHLESLVVQVNEMATHTSQQLGDVLNGSMAPQLSCEIQNEIKKEIADLKVFLPGRCKVCNASWKSLKGTPLFKLKK